jgi:hypothetical protein
VPPGETHAVRDVEDRTRPGVYQVLYLDPEAFGSTRFPGFPHAGGALPRSFQSR